MALFLLSQSRSDVSCGDSKRGETNCFFFDPPFLLVHQDWLLFSRQKYNHGQASDLQKDHTTGKIFFFFYNVNKVLGWKSFRVTHYDTVTMAHTLGRTKVQIVREVTCANSLKNKASDQWIVMCVDIRLARPQKSSLKGDAENGKDLYKEIILS